MALSVKTGTYTGNGVDNRGITGIGFQPKAVFIREITQTSGDDGGSMRFSGMNAGEAFPIGSNGVAHTDGIKSLDADGFTLGTSARVNSNTVVYYYLALAGTDVNTGTYSGNSTDNRNITGVGFQPLWVIVKGSNNGHCKHKMNSTGASTDADQYMTNLANASNGIQSLDADGFTVGTDSTVNTSGNTYYWFSVKTGSFIKNSSYTGNGTDNRNITGVGFVPIAVIAKGEGATSGAFNVTAMSGDNTAAMDVAGGANIIQVLQADGFQVGTDSRTNTNTTVYHYMAFATPTVAATGSFFPFFNQ